MKLKKRKRKLNKKCPLIHKDAGWPECLEGKCGWWIKYTFCDELNEGCAMKVIAEKLCAYP